MKKEVSDMVEATVLSAQPETEKLPMTSPMGTEPTARGAARRRLPKDKHKQPKKTRLPDEPWRPHQGATRTPSKRHASSEGPWP